MTLDAVLAAGSSALKELETRTNMLSQERWQWLPGPAGGALTPDYTESSMIESAQMLLFFCQCPSVALVWPYPNISGSYFHHTAVACVGDETPPPPSLSSASPVSDLKPYMELRFSSAREFTLYAQTPISEKKLPEVSPGLNIAAFLSVKILRY